MAAAEIPESLREQLVAEVQSLRDLAVTSSDPLVVAKAVAVSHKGIQQALLTRLAAGEQLAEVVALQGTTHAELQVFFRMVPRANGVRLTDTGLLAFVDMTKGEVTGTVEPYVLQRERSAGRPFVLVCESQVVSPGHGEQPMVDREHAFFRSLGLGGLGGLGVVGDTVCDTGVTSQTYSGTPYRADDTGQETTGDYCDSTGPILA
ncbi:MULTISPECIES: hypothetical protein [unclassified Streptomyces]|uniref:hypothetical protein n=1 Tax=unclassified Streptomyces TaxID=2593676 RepID=UPI0029B44D03|nr:hypothetical protein [Streptomyces sp. DK15]MDX2394877.1 hypothetical protein [Streptomyces sp. DK15]